MNRERDVHPCFSCTLPDCDESSPSCACRLAANAYSRAIKRGEKPTDVMRARYSLAFREIYLPAKRERMLKAAEARQREVTP